MGKLASYEYAPLFLTLELLIVTSYEIKKNLDRTESSALSACKLVPKLRFSEWLQKSTNLRGDTFGDARKSAINLLKMISCGYCSTGGGIIEKSKDTAFFFTQAPRGRN